MEQKIVSFFYIYMKTEMNVLKMYINVLKPRLLHLQLQVKRIIWGLQMAQVKNSPCLTVGLDVTAAPLQHPGHLSVDGVEAELGLGPPLRRAR